MADCLKIKLSMFLEDPEPVNHSYWDLKLSYSTYHG